MTWIIGGRPSELSTLGLNGPVHPLTFLGSPLFIKLETKLAHGYSYVIGNLTDQQEPGLYRDTVPQKYVKLGLDLKAKCIS